MQMEKQLSKHKLKIYVSESVMYGNDNFSSWLLTPSRPHESVFSSFDMYLLSSDTERYGMTNGSYPLVLCLQKSCRRFEHSYTVVRGSINNFATDRKWLLKTSAVRFFGTSAEAERCHFVNTPWARHTCYIVISLNELLEVFFFLFFFPKRYFT